MLTAATIAILGTIGVGYTVEGVNYNNPDKKADVNYVYDPEYYMLDTPAPFPEKCCSRCAVK